MITKKLYLESIEAAYEDEFTAEVIALEDNKIVLDQTLFYPLGGGQNWDLGTHAQGGHFTENQIFYSKIANSAVQRPNIRKFGPRNFKTCVLFVFLY